SDSNHLRVAVRDLEAAEATAITDDTSDHWSPRFDPSGRWLTFRELQVIDPNAVTPSEQHVVAQDLATGARMRVTSAPYDFTQAVDAPLHAWLADGRLAIVMSHVVDTFAFERGLFEFKDVGLEAGENRLVARATDPGSGLASPDSDTVRVSVPDAD